MRNLKLFSMIIALAVVLVSCNPDKTTIKFKGGKEVTKNVQVNTVMSAYSDEVTVTYGKGETVITANVPAWATFQQTGNKFTITGTAPDQATEVKVTITAKNNGVVAEQTLTINVTDNFVPEEKVIYSEDFGNGVSASPWPSVADYDSYSNGYLRGGLGGAMVVYSQEGGAVSIRGNAVSKDYPGASGACNAMMAANGASFVIKDIATCGARDFKFSFGCNQKSDTLTVAYRLYNTNEWVNLPFSKDDTFWGKVEVEFSVPEGTNTISLKFTAGTTGFGTRVDDLRLTTEGAVSSPVIDTEEPVIVDCPVVDLPVNCVFATAIPDCWTYIDPLYPTSPYFYSNGGLRLNNEGLGVTSREFNPQQSVKVTINIGAFNENQKTTTASPDVFTVTGYNASNAVVGTAAIQTVAVGNNDINLTGTDIVKVDVVMTGYHLIGTKYQNINLAGVTIASN